MITMSLSTMRLCSSPARVAMQDAALRLTPADVEGVLSVPSVGARRSQATRGRDRAGREAADQRRTVVDVYRARCDEEAEVLHA